MAKIYKDSATWSAGLSHDTASWSDLTPPAGTGTDIALPAAAGTGIRTHYDLGTGDDIHPSVSASGSGVINNILPSHPATGAMFAHPAVSGSGILRHFSTSGIVISHPAVSGAGVKNAVGTRTGTGALVSHPALSGTGVETGITTKTGTGALTALPKVSGAIGTLRHFGTGAVQPVITVTNIKVVPFSGIPPGKGASNVDGDEELRRRIKMFHLEKMRKRSDEDVIDALEALLKIL